MTSTAGDGPPSRTGDDAVDAALAPLAGLDETVLPQEQAAVLEDVLTALRQRLGAAEA